MALRMILPPQCLHGLTHRQGQPISQQTARNRQEEREDEPQHERPSPATSTPLYRLLAQTDLLHQGEPCHQEHADHRSDEHPCVQTRSRPLAASPQPDDAIDAQRQQQQHRRLSQQRNDGRTDAACARQVSLMLGLHKERHHRGNECARQQTDEYCGQRHQQRKEVQRKGGKMQVMSRECRGQEGHVLASGRDVNMLVLDTEVYSNTGGQASKATPLAAVAKFAARGKATPKKDLGMLAMAYGSVYVARVAMGANDQQTLRAFLEAEAYDGPSLIIAYSNCIAHGYDMRKGLEQQKLAVQSGYWPLYRYNPERRFEGKNPLIIDSKEPAIPLEQYIYNETRYSMLLQSNEERAESLLRLAKQDVQEHWQRYREMAESQEPASPPEHKK